MRIAIVGAGVSGLVAARSLQGAHQVVLLEAEDRAGGHVNTVNIDDHTAVDTGFIVFNTRTYPRFTALLGELGIGAAPSEMSFSVRSDRGLEYAGTDLSTLYAQRRRIFDLRHHRMVLDILRFFRDARQLVEADGDDLPLADWLRARRYSEAFVEDHLVPMIRAVWSANRDVATRLPARFLARFFANHGFLDVRDRVPWLTIPGGARRYVRAILDDFTRRGGELRTGARVTRIAREPGGVRVGDERFDHAVVACHADQALALLAEPSPVERELLGAFPYQRNDAVLHTDARVMPRLRRIWSSWNVHTDGATTDGPYVTYWMNRLQPLGTARDHFVTLNREIDPAQVIARSVYHHPIFTLAGVRAQLRHDELIDHLGVSYCGAYWRNGFHEDGVVSAERVAARLLGRRDRGVTASAIYEGTLSHARGAPPHAFAVDLRMLYLDLDELPTLRLGPWLSFRRRDYLGDPARPLALAVADEVERQLGARPDGPIRALTQVRSLGYVFNPVTFYYCFDRRERVVAVAAEITNTPWSERHTYVVPRGGGELDKRFHVSPFFPMSQRYRWKFSPPGDELTVEMENLEAERRTFRARLALRRRPLDRRALLTRPLMPWKVHASIYWQALRLFLKGAPFHGHP
jgi:predicted NAD/FAD-binding protein/DUF1365 family protein